MKIKRQDILLIIVIILAGYSILQMKRIKTDVKAYNQKVVSIQKQIDSVTVLNKLIKEQILNLDGEISSINNDINKVTKNITIIKNNTNEKVDNVNDFTLSELARFFSDRYERNTGYTVTPKNTNR